MSWLGQYGKLVSEDTEHATVDQNNRQQFYQNANSTPSPLRKLGLPQQSGQKEAKKTEEKKDRKPLELISSFPIMTRNRGTYLC